jgi:hypothetical protein
MNFSYIVKTMKKTTQQYNQDQRSPSPLLPALSRLQMETWNGLEHELKLVIKRDQDCRGVCGSGGTAQANTQATATAVNNAIANAVANATSAVACG